MKDCEKCGTVSPTNATTCSNCGKVFSDHTTRLRPDGTSLKFYGATAFIFGVLGIITAYWYPSAGSMYDSLDPSRLAVKSDLLLIGGVLAQIGAMGWLVGHIVDAISFLPGKDD
jgi:predicted nucleic acid-binding Zn ribbon protein